MKPNSPEATFIRVCRAPRQHPDAAYLLNVYRREPTPRLVALHRALTIALTTNADDRAFAEYRLPLLTQVLAEREVPPA